MFSGRAIYVLGPLQLSKEPRFCRVNRSHSWRKLAETSTHHSATQRVERVPSVSSGVWPTAPALSRRDAGGHVADWIDITKDPRHVAREKRKAKALRQLQWWRQRLANGDLCVLPRHLCPRRADHGSCGAARAWRAEHQGQCGPLLSGLQCHESLLDAGRATPAAAEGAADQHHVSEEGLPHAPVRFWVSGESLRATVEHVVLADDHGRDNG